MDELLGLSLTWIDRAQALIILTTAVVCIRRDANPLTALMLLGAAVVALVHLLGIFIDVQENRHVYLTTLGTNAIGYLFFLTGVCLLCVERTPRRAASRSSG